MVFMEPFKPRAKITEAGDAVNIEIPLRPKGFMAWFWWSILTAMLLAAWIFLIAAIVSPSQNKPPFLFVVAFLAIWLLITLLLSMTWWQITFGREIVMVTPQELIIWQRPFGQRRRYQLSEVKNLRVLEDVLSAFANPMWLFWMWHLFPLMGVLAFDYGAGTVRFGVGLEPAEARQIVALIEERFGKFMTDKGRNAGQ